MAKARTSPAHSTHSAHSAVTVRAEAVIRDLQKRLKEAEAAVEAARRARQESEDECERAMTHALRLEADLTASRRREEAAARQWLEMSTSLEDVRTAKEGGGKRRALSAALRLRELEAKEQAVRERARKAAKLIASAMDQMKLPEASLLRANLAAIRDELVRCAGRATILLVDDHDELRQMYCEYLEFIGYVVYQAVDGQDAIDIAISRMPSLIVMDLAMPFLDGWTATRMLKADQRTAAIPIVALTGHAMQEYLDEAKSAGCSLVLTKPCVPEDLHMSIERILSEIAISTLRPPPL
jgi:CheY-like chemotaxis protein